MICKEVNGMEEEKKEMEEKEGYEPRPAWEVWAARVGLVLMLLFVIYQIITIAGGGL